MPKGHLRTYGWPLLWLTLIIAALVSRPPMPIDETRYLSVAWEMWQSHQFLVPHINGIPYSQKPPLLFWLIQAGWWLFGVNDWSARLTAPLFGLIDILLALRLARVLWPGRRDLRNNIPYLLLGMWFWSIYSTLTMFDMLIVCFSLLAWLGLLAGRGAKQYPGWCLYAAAMGLGVLAKGPVILVYIVPPALLAPWWMAQKKVDSWLRWYGGFFLAVVAGALLALAWAIPAARAGGEQYGQAILFGQTAGRMVHSFAHQRPFYWYLLLLPLLFFPWFFWTPVWFGLRRLHLSSSVKFCLSILVPGFLLLSAISGKQIHYILPLLPLAALLIALAFDNENQAGVSTSCLLLPIFLFILSMVLFLIPVVPLHVGGVEILQLLPHWLGIGPLVAAIFLLKSKAGRKQPIAKISTILVLLLVFLHLSIAGPLHVMYDETAIGSKIKAAQTDHKLVAAYPDRLSDQFQFAGRLTAPLIRQQTIAKAALWSRRHPGQYLLLFFNKDDYTFFAGHGFAQPFRNGWLIFRSTKDFFPDYQRWVEKRVQVKK